MSPIQKMYFALFGITAFLGLRYSSASTQYLDQNPALQEYQDHASVQLQSYPIRQSSAEVAKTRTIFPLEEAWYIAYRNFESDPLFGGKAKCVRFSSNGVGEDGAYPTVFQYAPSFSANATITFSLSPGYTTENIANFEAQGQNISVYGISAYTHVKQCSVLRLPYAGEGKCILIVPESRVDTIDTCCNYIFDLLCGTTPKFNIFDSSCK